MVDVDDFVLIVKEVPMHPNSYLDKIVKRFEMPSIRYVGSKDDLATKLKKPAFDDKALVIFKTLKVLAQCLPLIKLEIALPVLRVNSNDDILLAQKCCDQHNMPVKVIVSEFGWMEASDFIDSLSRKEQTTESFKKTLLAQVGYSPSRIVSAMAMLESVGYTEKNVTKYVDKYIYTDYIEVIKTILKCNKRSAKRSCIIVHHMRYGFKYVKKEILSTLRKMRKIYLDILNGNLINNTILEYSLREGIPRHLLLETLDIYSRVSLIEIENAIATVSKSTLLELAYLVGGN